MGERSRETEIAFFGGSFTAIDRGYMISLLEAARPFVGVFYGIRISTRPDCIDDDILDILGAYGVTSIELGAQSMDNSVLELNKRGHTAEDVANASEKIKEKGFSLGLQMMTGLYGSTPEKDAYLSGRFVPYTLDGSVELCSRIILMFAKAGIKLIRLGLHYSDSLVENSLGGNYHPAFKELCESKILYDAFIEKASKIKSKKLTVTINQKSLSKFVGQKKSNLLKLREQGYDLDIRFDNTLEKYDLGVCDATEIS